MDRARDAWEAWEQGRVPERRLLDSSSSPRRGLEKDHGPGFYLDPDFGKVVVWGVTPPWEPFIPLADGRPALRGCLGLEARLAGPTLVSRVSHLGVEIGWSLRVFRGPEGTPLGEYPLSRAYHRFALSGDGELLARQVDDGQVRVHPVGGGDPAFSTPRGGFPQQSQIVLGRGALLLSTGRRHYHIIRWEHSHLRMHYAHSNPGSPVFRDPATGSLHRGEPGRKEVLPAPAAYDPQRFVASVETDVIAVLDRFGQVAIFDRRQRLVCMFFAFRDRLAVWMPDGTRLGPEALTGGPPTPGAAERIEQALWQASLAGRALP